MKILTIGNFYNPSWDSSIPDEEHIANALEELGHKVYRHQREESPQFIGHITGGYDFILIAQWDGYPKTLIGNGKELPFLEALKENYKIKWVLGAENTPPPIVYWAFDYQADGQEWHEDLVKTADLYLSKRIADSKYPNWQWLSQQFSPSFLDKSPPVEKDIDVLFTGSYLPWAEERNNTLKAIDEKFNLTICSVNGADFMTRGFKDVRGPVMDEQLPELIARAKLNIAIDHTLESGYWSDRSAQIMACGGFVLQRYVPLMETVFRQKIGYFYNIDDCLTKIESYLKMPQEDMDLMANIGYNYAHEELMVINTVSDLLTIVEGIL